MTVEDAATPVEVQTRYDQFPATIKGAFVMRGADGNPHAIELTEARVGRIPQGGSKPVPMESVRVDVAPGRDLFVPFEVAVSDLEPGWYAVFSSVRVDAGRSFAFFSRAFSVPWARDSVRRGSSKPARAVKAGRDGFVIEAVDLRTDCAVVSWRPASEAGSTEGASVRLTTDGRDLEAVASRYRPLGSRGQSGPLTRSVFYPVRRGTEHLGLIVTSSSGQVSPAVELPLP